LCERVHRFRVQGSGFRVISKEVQRFPPFVFQASEGRLGSRFKVDKVVK
jgi:hypothetical protein